MTDVGRKLEMDRRGELIDQLTKTAVLRKLNAEHWERIADKQRSEIRRLEAANRRLREELEYKDAVIGQRNAMLADGCEIGAHDWTGDRDGTQTCARCGLKLG